MSCDCESDATLTLKEDAQYLNSRTAISQKTEIHRLENVSEPMNTNAMLIMQGSWC